MDKPASKKKQHEVQELVDISIREGSKKHELGNHYKGPCLSFRICWLGSESETDDLFYVNSQDYISELLILGTRCQHWITLSPFFRLLGARNVLLKCGLILQCETGGK